MTPRRIVVIAGPTASGKTALACALAERLSAEVISADSQQCYRGLDVGTAKPTAAERAQAPHHLLDVADPEEQLDAAAFVRLADAAIAQVQSRGRLALVVGGTGLWLRALVRGLVDAPGADAGFRARLRERAEREGLAALHAELCRVDPPAGQAILPGDRVRIERALEVFALSGRQLSELQQEHRFAPRRYEVRALLLDPPRPLLAERIDRRAAGFFAPTVPGLPESAPLLEETARLLERIRRIPAADKALRIIGYGEAAEAIGRGCEAEAVAEASDRCAARTRQYAKRQRTWFAKDGPALDSTGAPLVLRGPGGAAGGVGEGVEEVCGGIAAWYESAPS